MARLQEKARPSVKVILDGDQPRLANGKRRLNLSIPQRELLAKNRQVEEAVALFLDPEIDRTNRQIADALGISLASLKRLTQTEQFRDIYEAALVDIGHSPRLKNVRASIDEMLPVAARVIRNILIDPNAPAGVRLKAATSILEYAPKDGGGGDQIKEFTAFLATFGEKSKERVTISVPNDYAAAMKQFADPDTVDAVVTELPVS